MASMAIVNRAKHTTDFIPLDTVLLLETVSATDYYGYDTELLDSMDLQTYSQIYVFYLTDGTTKVFDGICQIYIK